MDIALLTVVGIVAIALLFDYTNGFHDSANSIVLLGVFGAALLTVLAFGLRRTARSAHFEADRAPAGGRVAAG